MSVDVPTRLALYCRVSTNDQTVAPQLDALRSYGSARRLEVVPEFVDVGISGSRDRRPALDELIAAARRRKFEAGLITARTNARPGPPPS